MTTPDAVWKAAVTAAEEFDRLKAQNMLLGRPAAEYGRLCHGDEGHEGAGGAGWRSC